MAHEDYLNTKQAAEYLGCSPAWLEVGRARNYGPPFIRLAEGKRAPIRYRQSALDASMLSREEDGKERRFSSGLTIESDAGDSNEPCRAGSNKVTRRSNCHDDQASSPGSSELTGGSRS